MLHKLTTRWPSNIERWVEHRFAFSCHSNYVKKKLKLVILRRKRLRRQTECKLNNSLNVLSPETFLHTVNISFLLALDTTRSVMILVCGLRLVTLTQKLQKCVSFLARNHWINFVSTVPCKWYLWLVQCAFIVAQTWEICILKAKAFFLPKNKSEFPRTCGDYVANDDDDVQLWTVKSINQRASE